MFHSVAFVVDLEPPDVWGVRLYAAVFAVGEVSCIVLPYSRRSGSVLLPPSRLDSVSPIMGSGAERRLGTSKQPELRSSMLHMGDQRSCVELFRLAHCMKSRSRDITYLPLLETSISVRRLWY